MGAFDRDFKDVVFLTMYVLFFLIFLTAYISPVKSTVIYVDRFGEANVEMVIFSILMMYSLNEFFRTAKEHYKFGFALGVVLLLVYYVPIITGVRLI